MRAQLAKLEAAIAGVAANQHGVISVWQLRSLGVSRDGVAHRVASRRLHRVFRGVYAVGHPGVSPLGMWKAATLALGERAVLSHISAAMLWEMLRTEARLPEVTVAGTAGRGRRQGIVVHRSINLMRGQVTLHRGIPVTRPRRTIEDMRRTEPLWVARKAQRQAEYDGLQMQGLPTDGSRGGLETDYLGFFRRAGLPEPCVNEPVGRFDVDFSWPESLFAIETDHWKGHRGPEQLETAAALGFELAKLGYELIHLTSRQLREDPEGIASFLRVRLAGSA